MVIAAGAVAVAATAATSAYSASRQSKAAKEAASTQAEASDAAAQMQWDMYQQQRRDIAPWRSAGMQALGQLQDLSQQPPGAPFRGPPALDPRRFAFRTPAPFRPPTPESLANDPGYQFRLQSGQEALEGTAAARGGLLSGAALRGATQFGQQLGSQEYQQAYNRAMAENQLRYGRAMGENQLGYGRALTANQDRYNRALQQYQLRQQLGQTQWNRLAGLAGVGQEATQYLGGLGANAATRAGEYGTQGANAQAAGQIANAQLWSNFAQQTASGLGSMGMAYLQTRPPPPPQQRGYNPSSVPYDPWEFMGTR